MHIFHVAINKMVAAWTGENEAPILACFESLDSRHS
jgi:hypothetical protein